MRTKLGLAILVGSFGVAVSPAWAQDAQGDMGGADTRGTVRAPHNTTEIQIGTNYTQPFGNIETGRPIGDIADEGIGVDLDIGWRINPRLSVSWGGHYHESRSDGDLGRELDVRGGTTGLYGTLHLAPYERLDPYIKAGAGYRLLWQQPDGADTGGVLTHGVQLGKVQAGLDVRVSDDLAVGPYIGGDLNYFVWDNPEGPGGNDELGDRRVNTFIYAGVGGRFDIGGDRVRRGARGGAVAQAAPAPLPVQPAPSPYVASDAPDAVIAPPPVQAQPQPLQETQTGVNVASDILSACGINRPPRAFFEFDSTDLANGNTELLDQVAQCVSSGPLEGRELEVIGHTDPRGSEEYNEQLGRQRADSVASYLSRNGIPRDAVRTQSMGEQAARGAGPAGWSEDRRVEIRLVK